MVEGRIIKALSGFYYVQTTDGVYACKGRGLFRNQDISPLTGDHVVFDKTNEKEGYITKIKPRRNEFVRPQIANVTQAVIVNAATEPSFSPHLLDRFLVMAEFKNINSLILITKKDLATTEQIAEVKAYQNDYEKLGYKVAFLSLAEAADLQKILTFFADEVTVLMGQSGVGKSTLLNVINPALDIKTGEISTSLGRGRHTTRHVELIEINNGLVADTPGFSALELTELAAEDLPNSFIEIRDAGRNCRFRTCLHENEPNCAVKKAVESGEIKTYRYEHYLSFLKEILSRKPRY